MRGNEKKYERKQKRVKRHKQGEERDIKKNDKEM